MTIQLPKTHPLERLAKPWKADRAYRQYVFAQAEKTQAMRTSHNVTRIANLVGTLVRVDPESPKGRSLLCIGCRTRDELAIASAAGFQPVMGIDLVSPGPPIQPMDMHRLHFPDGLFDVIFACHSLEHAYDVDVALKEWARVTAPGGLWAIEVPINFTPTSVDRNDLKSVEGLVAACAPYLETVLLKEASQTHKSARLIGRVKG